MTDWCNKISLFSWLSGESTDRQSQRSKTASQKQKDLPADTKIRYSNETKQQRPQQRRGEQSHSFNKYSKNDNTIYFHKASGTNFDAKVVGVHFDDDPENPYYTIQYTASDGERVERQTTEDRLLPID